MGRPKTRILQIRVSDEEYKKLLLQIQLSGQENLSKYVRFVSLHHDQEMYRMVRDIHHVHFKDEQSNPASKTP